MCMRWPENDYRLYLKHSDDEEMKYGLPGKKKYPMPDREHVLSAIKFFNYVSPGDEKELARNILKRIREYGIEDINVGEKNRFKKYYKGDHLEHHGILGMHWGIRRFQNADGSLTTAGKERYSGKSSSAGLSEARIALKNGPEKYGSMTEYLNTVSQDCLPFDCGPSEYMSKAEIEKRADAAATLGLKALARMDPYAVGVADVNNPDDWDKKWFVYEDQTIGMALIADLVNQNYTAKECSKLIDLAENNWKLKYDKDLSSRAEGMIFDLDEGNYGGRLHSFAKSCEKIKAEESGNTKKNKGGK